MEKIKKYKWYIIVGVLLFLQVLSGVAAVVELLRLNMLPTDLLAALIGCFGVLLILNIFLMFPIGKKAKTANAIKLSRLLLIKKGVGVATASVAIVAGCIVTFYVGHLNRTVSAISTDAGVSNLIAVYVRTEDSAKEILDARNYIYGITEEYDFENTKLTREEIQNKVGKEIVTKTFTTVNDMVDALYREEIGAIILNKAYVDILTDQKKYAGFEEKLRVLFEYQIVEAKPETGIQTESESETETETETRTITEDPFIIYISGSDTRTSTLQTSRSDVNLLAVVNPQTRQVLLINTPRDYYINTPKAPGQMDKLTHCGLYGVDCSMNALSNLYQEKMDYYMQINFQGFREFTNAIGGVVVYNEKSFVSYKDNYSYPVGQILLSGDYALSYVRERKSFGDGDYQRGRNQMKVIKAIIEKLRNSNTLLTNYTEILSSLEGMFITNMTAEEMSDLVKMQLSDMAEWNVHSFTVVGTGTKRTTYTMPNKRSYVTIPDTASVARAQELIGKVYAGQTITDNDLN